ncbi:hypothetical protein SASPL_138784 [Salvia splendens]|uniref:Uncharacterized protein n=1 Tax=Salvia splendens TaxID=180675 RepID=A0A8X8WVT3_SALSN|nr:hypothetical protein SASPL_138784 [Salvia splendens]
MAAMPIGINDILLGGYRSPKARNKKRNGQNWRPDPERQSHYVAMKRLLTVQSDHVIFKIIPEMSNSSPDSHDGLPVGHRPPADGLKKTPMVASKALSALYDDVAIRRPRVIVARDVKWVGLAQPGLDPRVLFHEYFVVRRVYLFWLKKKRRQQDLSADAFPLRLFYWIFDKLETRGYFRAADRFQVLRT